jgi:6-phosphogluconolactonase
VSVPEVLVHRDAELLAQAVAARFVTRVVDVQTARGSASVVLTGGGIGIAVLAAVAASPARDAIDWRALHVWWGDERFVPADHGDRNDRQAYEALLDQVPVDPLLVHPMPASDGPDREPEAAAERYAEELNLAARPGDHGGVPRFDVLMLGLGPDAHVASLFPGLPALYETDRTVVGVRGSPKPPPLRVTLTMPAIRSAAEVWLIVSGAAKARAVHLALSESGVVQVPAAGARGVNRTLVLLDEAAASALPPGLRRIASP